MHFLLKNEKCATPWSTGCIENSGIQTSVAWWTVFDKIMRISQCWRRQTHAVHGLQESAGLVSRPVSSGKIVEFRAVLQMDYFYWKHPHEGGTCQWHAVGGCLLESSVVRIWRTAPRQELFWKCIGVGSEADATRIVVQVLRTPRKSHERP